MRGRGVNSLHERGVGDGFGHDDGQVALAGELAGQGAGAGQRVLQNGFQIQLKEHGRLRQFPLLVSVWVQLAQKADGLALQQHAGAAARVQGRVAGGFKYGLAEGEQGLDI